MFKTVVACVPQVSKLHGMFSLTASSAKRFGSCSTLKSSISLWFFGGSIMDGLSDSLFEG